MNPWPWVPLLETGAVHTDQSLGPRCVVSSILCRKALRTWKQGMSRGRWPVFSGRQASILPWVPLPPSALGDGWLSSSELLHRGGIVPWSVMLVVNHEQSHKQLQMAGGAFLTS